jgi:ABC-type multidrug transport system fused ATPase/permease subunit
MLKPPLRQLAITLLLLLLMAVIQEGSLDRIGHAQTEAGFKRALLVFAVSRGLNGMISVAQGTEVAVEPVGIGLNFKPGEILDPINDLVERFSWVMLASSASFGIQRILLDVMASPWLTYATVVAILSLLLVIWWPGRRRIGGIGRMVCRLALALLILRLSIALIAIGGERFYQAFLEPQYSESRGQLERAASQIGEVNSELRPTLPEGQAESLLDQARRVYDTATRAVDIEARMAAFNRAATNISENAINMIVVFLMQTVLFPLFSLWLLWQLLKRVLRARLEWLRRAPPEAGESGAAPG